MAKGDKKPVVMESDRAVPSGIATLDSVGNVPFAQLGNVVRPNLLDNWYLVNPVNQRGQTEYTEAGYMHDRWYGLVGGTLTGEGFKPTLNIGNRIIQQPLEDTLAADIKGKTVTLSVLLKNGGLLSVTGTSPFAKIIGNVNLSIAEKVWPQSDRTVFRIWMTSHTDDDTIIAAKLELGSTQTLAHQDADGNWVLNEIPDYGEELRKCKRYFERGRIDLVSPIPGFPAFLPGHIFTVEKRATPNVRIFGYHWSTPDNLVENKLADINGNLTTQTVIEKSANKYGINNIKMDEGLSGAYTYVYEASADL